MLHVAVVDVQPVLRDQGCGIRIVRDPLDPTPGRLTLQRIRDPDEVDELTGCVIDDERFVDLGPACVVFFDRRRIDALRALSGK